MAYVNLSHMPKQKTEYVENFVNLNGGLNISELEYRLKNDESPEMKNLLWREGVLCSRDGQEWITDRIYRGLGQAMYERPFNDFLVAHLGYDSDDSKQRAHKLYCCKTSWDGELVAWTEILSPDGSSFTLPEGSKRGSFFQYYGKLYYKGAGYYVQIEYVGAEDKLVAQDVSGYTPIIQINTDPDTGAGNTYQPENRIQPDKTVWFNAKSNVTAYHLPVQDIAGIIEIKVDGTVLDPLTDYTVNTATGVVTFSSAPPVTNPATNNTVVITYSKPNNDAYDSVMDCPYAATYGGTGDLCVVVGGCPAQPNAIFWNGNNIAMDPTYFPISQYQFCGDADDLITGFGKQQSYLVVFKEHSVGRVKQDTTTVDDRLVIDMPYIAINDKIGCDCPYSIQLIDNNLVWCNTHQGVHILKDSSWAYENNIACVSVKVNGGPTKAGLLAAIRSTVPVSLDDSKHYWLCCGSNVWVWDYENTTYQDPSWYFFTNINAVAFACQDDDVWHLSAATKVGTGRGRLTHFTRNFKDYDGPIEKLYRFAVQYFGGYDRLKNVNSVIIVMRPEVNTAAQLTYITDYEERADLTMLSHISWRLVPRDLTYRSLAGVGYGVSFRRKPMCRHVRHFGMQLYDNYAGHELSIVSAQIFYNYQGRLR